MKNRTLSLVVLAVLLISIFASTAYAHPGKTDSSGGHYDKSTGEYHYHHGYPAHDHRDMDGDGDRDCPYDFDDKTVHSSGSGTGSGSNTHISNSNETEASSSPIGEYSLWNDLAEFFSSPYGIFCIIAVILQIILAVLLMWEKLKHPYNWVGLITGIILFFSSIRVSGSIVLACGIIYVLFVFLVGILFPALMGVVGIVIQIIKLIIGIFKKDE